MKICDRCYEPTPATQEMCLVSDDLYFDLCSKHAQEIMEFLTQKEKPPKRLVRKNSAKAA